MITFRNLVVAGFAAVLLASCGDSNDLANGGANLGVLGEAVTSNTDASSLATRVYNLKHVGTRASLPSQLLNVAQFDRLSMGAAPAVPAGAVDITTVQGNGNENTVYVLKKGQTFNNRINYGNCTVYVEGTLNFDGWGSNVKLYVLPGGTLNWPENKLDQTRAIYNYGTLNVPKNGEFNVDYQCQFFNAAGLDWPGKTLNVNNSARAYVGGDLKLSSVHLSGNAQLDVTGSITADEWVTANSSNLSVGGSVKSKNLFSENLAKVHIANNVTLSGNLSSNGELYVGGDVKANGVDNINSSSCINIIGALDFSEATPSREGYIPLDGYIHVGGELKSKALWALNNCGLYSDCTVDVDGNFKIDTSVAHAHFTNIHAKSINQCASSTIYLASGGIINCEGEYNNQNLGSTYIVLEGDGSNAVFKAASAIMNGDLNNPYNPAKVFITPGSNSFFYLDCPTYYQWNNRDAATTFNFSQVKWANDNVREASATNVSINATACNGGGYNPQPDQPSQPDEPSKGPKFDNVSVIVPDHTHDISATCIQPYNGKLYMTYHTRGNTQGGCIEVFEMKNNEARLLQFLRDHNEELDFNHCMVDTKTTPARLYAVGNSKSKGAMLSYINIDPSTGLLNVADVTKDTVINQGTDERGFVTYQPLQVVPLDANDKSSKADENCIVRNGDRLFVTSTRGYEVYDANTVQLLSSERKPGKAKHIAMNADKISALYLNEPATSTDQAIKATVEEFPLTTTDMKTPTKTFGTDVITPNNGKNTIAIDGNNTYVCLSATGFVWYQDGQEVYRFKTPLLNNGQPRGYCNGVAFNDKYIFLAYGSYGVVAIDKATKQVVDRVKGNDNKSANYVYVDGDYVYVAYGKECLRVYTFK